MKIFRIGMYESPSTDRILALNPTNYAIFSAVGTWQAVRKLCEECDWHWENLVPPLLVQWEPPNTNVGDFSWDGPFGKLCVVKEEISVVLRELELPCEFLPTVVVEPESQRHCVPFPYEGPRLFWAQPQAVADIDTKASKIKIGEPCLKCGHTNYSFTPNRMKIRASSWSGEHIFRISIVRPGHASYTTEVGRQRIEKAGLSNIAFTEVGEFID